VTSYPLVLLLDTHVPGVGAGDNLAFVWNFWWARHVLQGGSPEYFRTGHLFAPFGTSLVLNTNTALQAWTGATVLGGMPLVRAHNVVLLCGLAANGFTSYLLAYAFTRQAWPSVLAGTAFASCAFVSVHMLGHFNLVHAWVLPLAALSWVSLLASPSVLGALTTGTAFAVAAYSDYYYAVYATLFAAIWWIVTTTEATLAWRPGRFRRTARVLLVAAAAALAAAAAIRLTSGFTIDIGAIRISAVHPRNPVSLAGLCLLAWVLVQIRVVLWGAGFRLRSSYGEPPKPWRRLVSPRHTGGAKAPPPHLIAIRRTVPFVLVSGAIGAVLAIPLAAAAVSLIRSGDYVSQQYFWRSAPRGVDLATVVLGNPMHTVSGARTRTAYEWLGINPIEQPAWLGIVPMLLLVGAIRFRASLPETARPWFWIAGVFAVWSLGPSLTVAGLDTGLLLPQALARYIPIVSNARMPGRALIFVQLAVGVLGAMAVSSWGWNRARVATLTVVLMFESLPAPYPLYRVPGYDAIDASLRASAPGAVVELPTGTRDGFGEWGRFDQRALAHQTLHERPLVGGAVSRVPPRVTSGYRNTPAVAALFELSDGSISADALPSDLGPSLRAAGVLYIVVDTDALGGAVRDALERRGLRLMRAVGPRELYSVD
jgi:hypothetical protein